MQTNMIKALAVAAVSVSIAACVESSRLCGDGDSVQMNGSSYCVYKEKIVIVGGFDCPASMPFRRDFQGATVCGDHGFDNINVPEDICARVFVPCTEPAESDAGLIPPGCDADECTFPGGTGVCTRSGECILRECLPGFRNCDGNPFNGCEAFEACGCEVVQREVCDGVDNDCDGVVDENDANTDCASAFANADSACSWGACRLVSCHAGFSDCDAQEANGCEVALDTDDNCGACGVGCGVSCATDRGRVFCIDTID